MKFPRAVVLVAAFAGSLFWSGIAVAQEQPPATTPAAPGAPVETKPEKPLREQTIYIPYSKLRETFEKEGRGVYLPYDQFQELWRKARLADQPEIVQRPPAGVLITDIESEASVERDVMVVRAKLKLEVLGEGWQEAPLRLTDAAIRSAQLGNEPARITWNQQQGYTLHVHHVGKEPKQLELSLEYAKGITKSPGLNTVSFAAPQAPINRWRIRIPQKGVKVNIQPLIAATEEPAAAPPAAPPATPPVTPPVNAPAEQTVLLAFVGAAPEVKVDWTPKSEGATGLEALATAQAQQEVTLEEGVLRTRVQLTYDISRAELSQLQVTVPANQKVTGVFDPNVRQWDVTTVGDEQTLTIQLFEPAKKTQSVTIELERFSDQLLMTDVAVPVVKAVGVGRQQGIVVVRIGEELRAEPAKRSGLLQVDAAELPAPLQGQRWAFAYRYSALPFELALHVEKVKPRIRTLELVEAYLQPESMTLNLLAIYDIQQAGVFQLELDLPAGYDVRHVRGQAVGGATAAAVDSHALTGDNKTRLKVNLARKALGSVALFVELFKQLSDPNLLSPTGQTSKLELPLPRTALSVDGTNGRLVVYAPESLRINPDQLAGLRSVPIAEAMQGVESQRAGRFPLSREVLAFVYTQDPATLSISTERRKPQVSVRQFLTARIEAGVVKYEATFYFDVQYSSVKTLRIDVPTALAADIRNVTPGIREKTLDPRPADAAEGFTPWSFTGDSEFLGAITLKLTWETKSKELEVGQSMDYKVPVLKPMGVDRAWGQIVVAKAETLDVNAKSGFTGLRPIDPQHDLMNGAQIPDAARAFEFHDDWSLTVTATRYELEDVKRTSIERAVIRLVVTRSQQITVQALYRLRSAVQRLAVNLPTGAQLDGDSLRINGRAVPLERGDKDEMYIPLMNQNPEEAFVIELRYTAPGNHEQLDFPVFPAQPPIQSEPAIQKVHLLVYLPEELALVGSRGPWTNEQANWYARLNGSTVSQDARQRINWVTEGIALQNNPADSFPTDGRLYEFTTLRPAAPPDGSLRLVAWNQRWLSVMLFGGLAIVGLVCVRRSWSTKLIVLALIVTAIVLIGVFAPTFTFQVLDPKLFAAIALILFLWLVGAARFRKLSPVPPPSVSPPPGEPGNTATATRQSTLAGEPLDTNKTVDAESQSPFKSDPPKPADGQDPGGPSHE